MEALLLIIAWTLRVILSPVLFIWGLIKAIYLKESGQYLKQIAIALDAFGNVLGQHTFNELLKDEDGYNFGNRKDTISYVLAINNRLNSLTKFGRKLAMFLNLLEKDHLEKAINNQIIENDTFGAN